MDKEFTVASEEDRRRFINFLTGLDISLPLIFSWKLFKRQRSLDANSLFHIWVGEVTRERKKQGKKATEEKTKTYLKEIYLGYELITHTHRKTGEIIETTKLRRTRDLDSGEMFFFMEQVQAWALLMLDLTLVSKNDKDEFSGWKREELA